MCSIGMKNYSIIRCSILLFIVALSFNSCNRPEGKDPTKNDQPAIAQVDTPKPNPPSQVPMGSGNVVIPMPSTGVMPELPQSPGMDRSAPIGSIPLLRPQQLAEFHPRLPDFNLSKAKEVDEKDEVQSVILFRNRKDTSRTIKSTIIDINEKGASKLIKEMAIIQKAGKETRVVEGESITSYYVKIKDMPAIKAYIASKNVANLYILVGDHRAVVMREEKVASADHLVEAAKTIDFKKLETLSRN